MNSIVLSGVWVDDPFKEVRVDSNHCCELLKLDNGDIVPVVITKKQKMELRPVLGYEARICGKLVMGSDPYVLGEHISCKSIDEVVNENKKKKMARA